LRISGIDSARSKRDTKIEIDDAPAANRVGSTESPGNIYRLPFPELQRCIGVVVAREIAGGTADSVSPN